MGLDQAAQSIISEHLNQDYTLEESGIMEAICDFMIKYPHAGRDFRREVRDLIEEDFMESFQITLLLPKIFRLSKLSIQLSY